MLRRDFLYLSYDLQVILLIFYFMFQQWFETYQHHTKLI